ncbi:hypothetical protein [Salmonella enterica]|nr:hypothetical protein [Salmonella enterica]
MIMGNDDLLADGALSKIVKVLKANPEIVLATRAYGWFKENPNELCDTVRHLTDDTLFQPGLMPLNFSSVELELFQALLSMLKKQKNYRVIYLMGVYIIKCTLLVC